MPEEDPIADEADECTVSAVDIAVPDLLVLPIADNVYINTDQWEVPAD